MLTKNPFVSVIVQCHNSEKTVSETLESLLSLEYPKSKYEIIVVDDASTDDTENIVKKFPVRYIRAGYKQVFGSKCRNIGIQNSNQNSEFIAFNNSNSEVDKNWLNNLLRGFDNEKIIGVGGPNLLHPRDNIEKKIVFYSTSTWLGSAGSIQHTSYKRRFNVRSISGCNFIYRKEVFDIVGYFDEDLFPSDDTEFNFRVIQNGFKLMYVPDAIVYHHGRGFRSLMKKMYIYGVTRGHISIKISFRLFTPTIFLFYLWGILSILSILYPPLSVVFLFGAIGYILLLFFSTIQIFFKSKSVYMSIVGTLIIPLYHISYFLGLTRGLLSLGLGESKHTY